MALSNYDIMNIGKEMGLEIVGVFSKDQMPLRHQVGSYYINLQNHDEGNGTHWVFARIFENGRAIYFDPFGTLPPIEVRNFLKPFSPYATSNRYIQDNHSNKCGYFCIGCDVFFTYDYKKGQSIDERFDDFLNMFSIQKKLNDKIIFEYLNK